MKFTVVRHPYFRLLSCYLDKYEGIKKKHYYKAYGEKMVTAYREVLFNLQPEQVLRP